MDISSDFLHTPMDPKYPKAHMALRGKLAELMLKVDTKLYMKFVSTDSKGLKILYVEMQKALYGMLKYMLLFYLNIVGDLTRAGLKFNLYDPCLMNKIVGGEQMTVVFHVDYLKVSHKSDKDITKVI